MADKNHDIEFNTDHLLKYHAGQLSASEMNALEKAALDDPFLADALDGIGMDANAKSNLEGLEAKINDASGYSGKPAGKIISIHNFWPKIAAACVLIFLLGYVAWFFNKPDGAIQEQPIIAQNKAGETTAGFKADSAAPSTSNDTRVIVPEEQPTLKQKNPNPSGSGPVIAPVSEVQEKTKNSEAVQNNASQPPAAEVVADLNKSVLEDKVISAQPALPPSTISRQMASEKDELVQAKANSSVADFNTSTSLRKKESISVGNTLVRGKVIDENRKAIPNASIVLETGTKSLLTDTRGYFSIQGRSTDSVELMVGKPGYFPEQVFATPGKEVEVVLSKSKTPESGLGGVDRSIRLVYNLSSLPLNGLANYQDYIDKQVRDGLLNSLPASTGGMITLKFDTNSFGSPINIRPENGGNSKLSGLAVQLLENGPKWTVSNKKDLEISFMIN